MTSQVSVNGKIVFEAETTREAIAYAEEYHNDEQSYTVKDKNPAAVALGSMRSDKKAASSRENGKKGGRPKKEVIPSEPVDATYN